MTTGLAVSRFVPRNTAFCLTFLGIWAVVFVVPLLGMMGSITTSDPMGWHIVHKSWLSLLPYFVVSAISEFLLMPLFFNRGRIAAYVMSLAVVLGGFALYEYNEMDNFHKKAHHRVDNRPDDKNRPSKDSHPPKGDRFRHGPSLAVPVATRVSIAMLIIGCGIGVNLMVKYRKERARLRELEKCHLEQELAGLRAQISPHFFMNMLNNIHSMMDTDVGHAQDMLLKMSELMRYVTYDSSLNEISLSREVAFVRNYLSLMSDRYPAERVTVKTDLPDDDRCRHATVPTMVFITFIENAFKHGVTYRQHTVIETSIDIIDDPDSRRRIIFTCTNTVPPADRGKHTATTATHTGGVGLANVRRRLEMLYGDAFTLSTGIDPETSLFTVTLNIPANENTMPGN